MGLSAEYLLNGTELDEAALADTRTKASVGQVATVYARLVEQGHGTETAFEPGRALTPFQYGAFGVAIVTATCMAEEFDPVFLYPELESTVVQMRLESHGDMTRHVFRDNVQATGLNRFLVEIQTAMAVSFMKKINGSAFPIKEIWFTYDASDEQERYDEIFGCTLRFGQPYNACLSETWMLKQSFVEANALTNVDMNDL
ncbi:AraC family transcriptional regulator ligand-binding domain-containing protein [Ruegeria sp. Alg231-54]|uniref:AraC family transcriptional regulator ligand-binding domain-containing protein n=1 Tax=Ruegeria sp. Alg231-54 TaxID=1922221 RepID=UPI00131F04BA|nr:AraC family transcriptional regulator ligand-binding domain-containing protein [Ruegeria sp. Alg231-54]